MADIKLPAFCEENYTDEISNSVTRVLTLKNSSVSDYERYLGYFEENGFEKKEEYEIEGHSFAAFSKESDGIFINYFDRLNEIMIAVECDTNYFLYADEEGEKVCQPSVTQVGLEDYGMSYAVRLSDGRFIIIDGAWNKESDIDGLYNALTGMTKGEKPVIAAWILTHPHEDHYLCFIGFMNKYGENVEVQKFMFYFPEPDDFVHYPNLDLKKKELSPACNVPIMLDIMKKTGSPIYAAHTGQRYRIGDADCEILSSMDDTIHLTSNSNAISTVVRMELGGQVILFGADASFSYSKLAKKHGNRLKADILQIPHHGFQSGSPDGEIESYDLIRPSVCFLPTDEYFAYLSFCIHRKSTRYLMRMPCVKEIYEGGDHTLMLPYYPPEDARHKLETKLNHTVTRCGAYSWVFTGLNSSKISDFTFTVSNLTYVKTEVRVDLYFDEPKRCIPKLMLEMPRMCQKQFCIAPALQEDEDVSLRIKALLERKGIGENEGFTARFISDVPIIVSHADHKEAYHDEPRL